MLLKITGEMVDCIIFKPGELKLNNKSVILGCVAVDPDPVNKLRHKNKLKGGGQKVFTFYPSLGRVGRIMAPKETHFSIP